MGNMAVQVLGVDDAGAADHDPTVGEAVWAKVSNGALGCSTEATVTGYVKTK